MIDRHEELVHFQSKTLAKKCDFHPDRHEELVHFQLKALLKKCDFLASLSLFLCFDFYIFLDCLICKNGCKKGKIKKKKKEEDRKMKKREVERKITKHDTSKR